MTTFEKVLKGLQIIAKYPEPSLDAQHDELYAGCESDVSDRDAAELESLGWREFEGRSSWVRFT